MAQFFEQQSEAILAGDHHAVDGEVSDPGVRIFGNNHAGGQVATTVTDGVVRHRQFIQVYIGLDNLVGRPGSENDGLDGIFLPTPDFIGEYEWQLLPVAVKYFCHDIQVPVQTYKNRVITSFHLFEQHHFTAFEAFGDTGQLQGSVHFRLDPNE